MTKKREAICYLLLFLVFVGIVCTLICLFWPISDEVSNSENSMRNERDPQRESLDEAFILNSLDAGFYLMYLNNTHNKTYFDYLIYSYPSTYQYYQSSKIDISFVEFLERFYTQYPLTVEHSEVANAPLSFCRMDDSIRFDPKKPVIHLSMEEVENTPLLRLYLLETDYFPVKVLDSELEQLTPYKSAFASIGDAYLEWKGKHYWISRSVS